MLIIKDIAGNTEALTGYKGLKRFRSVSGEKTLAFLIFPTDQNAHSFDMVQEESVIEFRGDTYRIKQVSEKPRGQTYLKEVVAIHTLFDLIDEYIYEKFNGSKTFQAFLEFVFAGTAYTWDIVDSFYAQDWENLGDNNRLALFQDGLKRYGAEFTLSGTHFTIKQEIGNDTDFQFRYGYNIKTINRNVNTNNLSTYIKGYGKKNEDGSYLIQSEYTSPNSTIFGIRHAKPVDDERYTTVEGLNERLKAELKDTPEVSITLDFVDLRRAGFPYDVPNEGDDVFLFYEPMKLDLETRIMDITEEFTESSDYPIKTDVTLANFRNNMTDQFVEFSRTQKQVDGLFNGNKQLPFNALDEMVKRTTAALLSAQTELEFVNGIIGRSKTDPNQFTIYNSAGFGITKDNGQTFVEAITVDGFNLSAGAIGQLAANNIQIGPGTTFENGYDPKHGEIFLRGTGWNRPANRSLKVNGQTIYDYSGDRGIRVTLLNRHTLSIYEDTVRDTFGDESQRNDLADKINWYCANVPDTIFILTSFDAIDWNSYLIEQVKKIGGSSFPSNRIPYALIGMANIGEGAGIQVITGEGANDPYAEISTKVINGMVAGINMQASSLREDLRLTAPLPTSITMNQDGFRASNPDGTRYLQLDYRGGYAKRGAFTVERDDGFLSIVDGKLNQSYDVFGSNPPYMIDTHQNGRYFQLNSGVQRGYCQQFTIDRKARYLKLQVTIGSEIQGYGARFWVTSTSDTNTILGQLWTTNGISEPTIGWITVDLGVPDGSEYAIYCHIGVDGTNYFSQSRIIRIKQTDFL